MPMTKELEAAVKVLGLNKKELRLFWVQYMKADSDRSGELSPEEFTSFLGIEHTRFAERVFTVMDLDGSGVMDFLEFTVSSWNFGSLDHGGVHAFIFDLFDVDGSGTLSSEEIKQLFAEICGEEFAHSAKAIILFQRIDDMAKYNSVDGEVTVAVFSEFLDRNPDVILQAVHMQNQIKERIGTPEFWDDQVHIRVERFMGAKDCGWSEIRKALSQIMAGDSAGGDLDFAQSTIGKPRDARGVSKEQRLLLEKREQYLLNAGNQKHPAVVPEGKSESEYVEVFREWKRGALNLLEESEHFLNNKVTIEVVPDRYIDDGELRRPQRTTSLTRHNELGKQESDRVAEFHRSIQDTCHAHASNLNAADVVQRTTLGTSLTEEVGVAVM